MLDTSPTANLIAVVDDAEELAGLVAVLAAALSTPHEIGETLANGLAGLAWQAEALAGGIAERLGGGPRIDGAPISGDPLSRSETSTRSGAWHGNATAL